MTAKRSEKYPGFDVRELRFSGMLVEDSSGRQVVEAWYLIVTNRGNVVTANHVRYASMAEMARVIAHQAREGLGT